MVVTTLNENERCCGTCEFSSWLREDYGECHGGYWEVPDATRWHLPRHMRPTVKIRPFLLSKGNGSKCMRYSPIDRTASCGYCGAIFDYVCRNGCAWAAEGNPCAFLNPAPQVPAMATSGGQKASSGATPSVLPTRDDQSDAGTDSNPASAGPLSSTSKGA